MLRHYSSLNAPAHATLRGSFAKGLASGPDDEPAGPSGNGSTQTIWGQAGTQATNYATDYVKQNSKGWFKKISFNSIGNWFSTPINCWGGTAYNDGWIKQDVEGMGKYCQLVLDEMNVALATGNMTAFSNKENELRGMAKMFVWCVLAKIAERQWNGCSFTNFQKVALAAQFYHEVMLKAVDAWLDKYFTATPRGTSRTFSYANVTTPNNIMPFCGWAQAAQTQTVPFRDFARKPGEIPVFQPTEYLYNLVQTPASFNPNTFLQGLQQAYNAITNPSSIFTGGNTPGSPGTVPGIPDSPNGTAALPDGGTTRNAGVNVVLALLAIGTIAYGATQFKNDKPLKRK